MNCVFIGYAMNSKACWFSIHKFDNPETHVNTKIEWDTIEFFEHIYQCKIEWEPTSERRKQKQKELKVNILSNEDPRSSLVNGNPLLLDQILWNSCLKMSVKHSKQQCLRRSQSIEKKQSIVRSN